MKQSVRKPVDATFDFTHVEINTFKFYYIPVKCFLSNVLYYIDTYDLSAAKSSDTSFPFRV